MHTPEDENTKKNGRLSTYIFNGRSQQNKVYVEDDVACC
jgi:hypothetical protein